MPTDTSSSLNFWDAEVVQRRHSDWMALPGVRGYLNTMIGGTVHDWPFNWFVKYLNGRRLPHALSIGCGTGALERDLIRRDICDRVVAFDGSTVSLATAKTDAVAEGFGEAIHYFAADFNEPVLPRNRYDAVFFHHSLHHVAKLEKLLRAVLLALKPNGLLYLDEYLGPSRTWWTDDRFRHERAVFDKVVPQGLRVVPDLPLPIVYEDPSEAVRSGEIMEQVTVGFEIDAFRGYGGNLLSLICPAVDWSRAPEGTLEQLMAEETELLRNGTPPFLGIVVATPKRGLAKAIASARYFTEPKVKRVFREAARIMAAGPRHDRRPLPDDPAQRDSRPRQR